MTTVTVNTSSGPYDITVDGSHLLARYGKENAHVVDAIASYLALLDSSPLHCSGQRKPIRVFRHFATALETDLKALALQFSSYFDLIVSSTTLYGSGSLTGTFLLEMRDTPIFFEYNAWFKTGDPHLFAFISSFLLYLKKLDFHDTSFHDTAFRGWEKNEEKLSKLILPDTSGLRDVMSFLLRDFRINNPYGKFGPGHVSERHKGVVGKSSHFSMTPRLERAFCSDNQFTRSIVQMTSLPSQKYDTRPATDRYSRVVFVPKNLKTSRSICIEPNAEMFFQQMVLKDFVDYFDDVLHPFIDLRDQSRNQRAAYFGSLHGDIDTIDLSSASDLVSMDLIRSIMPRHVLYFLVATRSSRVKTPKGTRDLNKFAPMGSALCFPIQCLVFLSVNILAAIKWRKGSNDLYGSVTDNEISATIDSFSDSPDLLPDTRLHRPLVYGDDIVVDSKLTATVTQMLESFGFEVNISKSYTASCAFRESCGGFYWNGFDITPLQYRIPANWNGTEIASFASSCAHVNRALEYGYYRLRIHHINVLRSGRFPLLFTNEEISHSIRVLGLPYNPHLRGRYNKQLQRHEVRSVGAIQKSERDVVNDNIERYGYMRWWAATLRPEVVSSVKGGFRRSDSFDSRPKWRWTPFR